MIENCPGFRPGRSHKDLLVSEYSGKVKSKGMGLPVALDRAGTVYDFASSLGDINLIAPKRLVSSSEAMRLPNPLAPQEDPDSGGWDLRR